MWRVLFILSICVGPGGSLAAELSTVTTTDVAACAQHLVNTQYAQPIRGTPGELNAYRMAMDAVYLQKLALMVLLLPSSGIAVDMGSGSGTPTAALAQLYPNVQFIGVDINPEMVAQSASEFDHLKNLNFKVGDIAQILFPPESVDVIINSSVLHHVTSFAGEGYRSDSASAALANQVRALKMGGILIVRDFVIPRGPQMVPLKLPKTDGLREGPVQTLSTAALFYKFAHDFRSSVHPDGFTVKVITDSATDTTFDIDLRTAVEFLFHKDYREHWGPEVKEEYTYFSQRQFENLFRLLNLRILTSRLIFNPWLIAHRLKGQYEMTDEQGNPLPYPPTNILILGEKVHPGRPVEIVERDHHVVEDPQFLRRRFYENRKTGEVFAVAERPQHTLDVVPYTIAKDQLFVMSRKSYPRPILTAKLAVQHLNGANTSGYITEPISLMMRPGPTAGSERIVEEFARTRLGAIKSIQAGSDYFPSAGFLREQVLPYLVEVEGALEKDIPLAPLGGLTDMGSLHWTEAGQALRAYHVGGAYDSRFEINLYRLLLSLKRPVGPWIGGEVRLKDQSTSDFGVHDFSTAQTRTQNWKETTQHSDYIEIRSGHFTEMTSTDTEVGQTTLEYLIPKHMSHHTVTLLPIAKNNGEILVGLEPQDLPVPQSYGQSSTLWTVPGFRIPKNLRTMDAAVDWSQKAMAESFAVHGHEPIAIGSDYRVSPGTTPEIVYPYVIEVDLKQSGPGKLTWFRLKDLLQNQNLIHSAHLLTSLFRTAHALDLHP